MLGIQGYFLEKVLDYDYDCSFLFEDSKGDNYTPRSLFIYMEIVWGAGGGWWSVDFFGVVPLDLHQEIRDAMVRVVFESKTQVATTRQMGPGVIA